MSVLRRNRSVAFTEFERQACNLYKETNNRLNTLPSRYKKFFRRRICEPCNLLCDAVIMANEQRNTFEGIAKRKELFSIALVNVQKLQKPMLSYFNLKDCSEGGMLQWANMANREIELVCKAMKQQLNIPMIHVLPTRKMKTLHFMNKMSELHKYTYQKLGHAPTDFEDTLSLRVACLVDDALYGVVMANEKIPETPEEFKRREDFIQYAIDSLNSLQRPLYAIWNIVEYSENTMDTWAGLLNEELKLLEGLKKSDYERYKHLKT